MEHMHNKECVGKKHLSEEKRFSFKDGTQMNGTDKPDRQMSVPQMFTISNLINRLNWCVAGANFTCLTGTSAPSGLFLFTCPQLIADRFYEHHVHRAGCRQIYRCGAMPLRTVESNNIFCQIHPFITTWSWVIQIYCTPCGSITLHREH